MAYTAHSLIHDAKKGTSGVDVNGYALVADLGVVEPTSALPDGSRVAIVSDASTALPTITSASSSGVVVTGVGTAFLTEVSVGDVIFDATSGDREVVSITSDTVLNVNAAFAVAVAGTGLTKYDTAYHVDNVLQLRPFKNSLHFKNALRQDAPLSANPRIVYLGV